MYADELGIENENKVKSSEKIGKSLFLLDVEQRLKKKISRNVSLRGNEDKGSIKISYKSNEELLNILELLDL